MLRRNMKHFSANLRLSLEDLLADLWHARRSGNLGRLALLSYYEVRRWARLAGEQGLVEHSSVLVTGSPYADRQSFMADADRLIAELEQLLKGDSGVAWSGVGEAAAGSPIVPDWRPAGPAPAEPRH